NGDAPAVASTSTEGPIPPKTDEQKIARKNESRMQRAYEKLSRLGLEATKNLRKCKRPF
ncbi:hypothetical protein Tco_0440324, partial [Tanacetum coccineum]